MELRNTSDNKTKNKQKKSRALTRNIILSGIDKIKTYNTAVGGTDTLQKTEILNTYIKMHRRYHA